MTEQVKKTVFSGVQPSGAMHLGGYLGAFRNWVALQDDDAYDVIYCVVDLHAMTVPYDPAEFHSLRLETAKVLLAIGIDPDRSLLYMQSQVPMFVCMYVCGSMYVCMCVYVCIFVGMYVCIFVCLYVCV